jgi:C4-type Zn-finger protein
VIAVIKREHESATVTLPGQGDVTCPRCGRFLTERRILANIPVAAVWTRVLCTRCNHWRWIDLANGTVLKGGDPPRV